MADQTLSQLQSGGSLGFNLGQMAGVIPSTAKLASSAGLGGVYQAASSLPSIGGTLFGSAIPAGELAAAGTLGGIGPTTAAAAGGLFGGAGLGALGTALPYVGLGLGALALVSSFRKPSVGPNFNLRFSGTGGSQVIPRQDTPYGFDNGFSPVEAQRYSQSFSERISGLLNRIGGTAVDNGLEGTIGYNRKYGGYFSQFDEADSTQTAADLDEALVRYLMGNIDRSRIMADPDALRAALEGGNPAAVEAMNYEPTDWNDYRAWLSTLGDDGGSKGAASAAVLPQLAAMMQARQAPVDPFTAWAQEVQAMRGGGGGAPAFSGGFGGFGGGIGPQSGYGGGDPDDYGGGGFSGGGAFYGGGDPDDYGGGGFSGGGFSGGDPDSYGGGGFSGGDPDDYGG